VWSAVAAEQLGLIGRDELARDWGAPFSTLNAGAPALAHPSRNGTASPR
jgi:hypothetical protein